jgi:hypothetical protein
MKLTAAEAARLFDVTPEPTGLVVSFQKCLRDSELLRLRREELCRSLMHSFRLIGATQVMASHCALRITCDAQRAQMVHAVWPAVARTLERIAKRPSIAGRLREA